MHSSDYPYNRSLQYKNTPGSFKTTYGTSYINMPTLDVSPAYEPFREPHKQGRWFPEDLSPYPAARSDSPIELQRKRPYQPMTYYEEDEFNRKQKEREFRSRFEDATLKRDQYMEPPPRNAHDYEQEPEFETFKRSERDVPEGKMRNWRSEYQRARFDDLVAEGQSADHHDLKNVFCNKCFKTNVCMNKLCCCHQYCDECMSMMPGSDSPFRAAIRWHYCCDVCKKYSPEDKVIRTDPYGRRLMKSNDIGHFKTS